MPCASLRDRLPSRLALAVLVATLVSFSAACSSSGESNGELFGNGPVPTDDAGEDADAGADAEPVGDAKLDATDAQPDQDAATKCQDDGDCAGSAFGSVCDVPSGRCGQCSTAADACATGGFCRATDLKCVPGCTDDADCAAGGSNLTCDKVQHVCIGCTKDADCALGTLCDGTSHACRPGCSTGHGCPGSDTCCNGQCADTTSDTANCGSCGNGCAAAAHATIACSASACVIGQCAGGYADCNGNYKDGCEVDLAFDPKNCGACFSACSGAHATVACVNMKCEGTCASGWSDCDGDLRTNGCEAPTSDDPDNCGGCGVSCSGAHVSSRACSGGKCTGACSPGWSDCNGDKQKDGCEAAVDADPKNCGACGATCSKNHVPVPTCSSGSCDGTCEVGWADCNGNEFVDGCETSVSGNVDACGGCGRACSATNVDARTCTGGTCTSTCSPGFSDCNGDKQLDGCETWTGGSAASCGGCGVICSSNHIAAPSCSNGTCNGACNAGFADCNGDKQKDGCESATSSDPNNCGGCGTVCSGANMASRTCSGGACNGACASGWSDCNNDKQKDGCEKPTGTDPANCGGCGVVCSGNHIATVTCGGGTCNGACETGWADCNGNKQTDGCETFVGGTDVNNCGGCGVACSQNNIARACVGGSCNAGTCSAGFTDCNGNKQTDGCEVATGSDLANCGGCGQVCSTNHASATCTSGSCSQTCASGFTDCNGSKADGCEAATASDVGNCGGCGTVCSTNNIARTCSAGTCNGTCLSGFTDCNGNKQTDGCETATGTDLSNCGGCGVVCSANHIARSCVAGSCSAGVCSSGWADCNGNKQPDGCETPITADADNCGGCGVKCSANHIARSCAAGSCNGGTCESGFADCNGNKQTDGCEVDTTTSLSNCGGCGQVCSTNHASATCTGGTCNQTCASGWTDCNGSKSDGCEVATGTDVNNCGACGEACSTNHVTRSCSGSSCQAGTCATGWGDCNGNKKSDGCETSTVADVNNCGSCGNVCPTRAHSTPSCASSTCGIVCDSGWANCDGNLLNGCETDLTSPTACGACGKTCSTNNVSGVACVNGTCQGTCNSGFENCDGNLQSNGCEVNLNSDPNNCSACGTICSSTNMSTRTCSAGACSGACATGYSDCDGNKQTNGCERSIRTLTDCGACDVACAPANATASCSTGTCSISSCASGWSNCTGGVADGCETQTSVDVLNCGACGKACSTSNISRACTAGVCNGDCTGNFNDCNSNKQTDGCESNPDADPNNCSGCGVSCSSANMATRTCGGGVCNGSCATNYQDCNSNKLSDGCESNKLTDKNNCGNCGNACPSGQSCVGGVCGACNNAVLVIGAVNSSSALTAALNAAGLTPTVLTTAPTSYSGSPAATGFGAIIIDVGGSYSSDMPAAGQQSIMNAIQAGAGIGFTDWVSYTYPNYTSYYAATSPTLRSYVLFSYTSSWSSGTWTLTNSSYASTIWSGLPTSFAPSVSLAGATGSIINGGTSIATVASGPGVVIRDPASGARAAHIVHAADSYSGWSGDANLVKLFANTAKWLTRCQ